LEEQLAEQRAANMAHQQKLQSMDEELAAKRRAEVLVVAPPDASQDRVEAAFCTAAECTPTELRGVARITPPQTSRSPAAAAPPKVSLWKIRAPQETCWDALDGAGARLDRAGFKKFYINESLEATLRERRKRILADGGFRAAKAAAMEKRLLLRWRKGLPHTVQRGHPASSMQLLKWTTQHAEHPFPGAALPAPPPPAAAGDPSSSGTTSTQ